MVNISYEGNAKSKSESTNSDEYNKKDSNNCEGVDKLEPLDTAWWAQNDLTLKMAWQFLMKLKLA